MARDNARLFTFEVDETSDVPLWAQLRARLAHLITTGYYQPGEQLPTVRALASAISINYNTVNRAYLALKSDGYIESTPGRGAFVRDLAVEVDEEHSREVDAILGDCVAACRDLGMTLDDVSRAMDAKIRQIKLDEGLDDLEDSGSASRVITIEVGARRTGTGA